MLDVRGEAPCLTVSKECVGMPCKLSRDVQPQVHVSLGIKLQDKCW